MSTMYALEVKVAVYQKEEVKGSQIPCNEGIGSGHQNWSAVPILRNGQLNYSNWIPCDSLAWSLYHPLTLMLFYCRY